MRKLRLGSDTIPLIVLDDPQDCFGQDGTLLPGAERFFASLVGLHKIGMLNVVFLSSGSEAVQALRQGMLSDLH